MSSSSPTLSSSPATAAADASLLVRALFDFRSTDGSSLSFRAGDVIHVYHRLETGWWDGVFEGCRGCVACSRTVLGRGPPGLENRKLTRNSLRCSPTLSFFRWLPSNYVVALTDDEIAQLEDEDEDEDELGRADDDDDGEEDDGGESRSVSAGGTGGPRSQELYSSTPADGVVSDEHLYWVPRVRLRFLRCSEDGGIRLLTPLDPFDRLSTDDSGWRGQSDQSLALGIAR